MHNFLDRVQFSYRPLVTVTDSEGIFILGVPLKMAEPQTMETPNHNKSAAGETSTSKKKKKIPISIETVFNQVSVITAANINPPPGKILLTPRSAESVII